MSFAEKKVVKIFELAGIQINGSEPSDIQVSDSRFFRRFLVDGSLGLGESYQEGWWDCAQIDEMIFKLMIAKKHIAKMVKTPSTILNVLVNRLISLNSIRRSKEAANFHYSIGNELFEKMLDPTMNYTCAYWQDGAETLEQAQVAKMDRICKKLELEPGMRVIDLGCGFGGLVRHMAENYGVRATGITASRAQVEYAQKRSKGLPVDFVYTDYREATGKFDRVVSVGMTEHVGAKYYRAFMQAADSLLKDDGLFVIHTIGFLNPDYENPWLTTHIFPGAYVPPLSQLAMAYEDVFVLEHLENFGLDYVRTLKCWFTNFDENWEEIRQVDPEKYNERFYRTWKYYLHCATPSFLSKRAQLWQMVLSKGRLRQSYRFQG